MKPVRTSLGVKPIGGESTSFEVIAKAIEPVKPCEVSVTSRIVETDRDGREVSPHIIFQGRGHRGCGGVANQPLQVVELVHDQSATPASVN